MLPCNYENYNYTDKMNRDFMNTVHILLTFSPWPHAASYSSKNYLKNLFLSHRKHIASVTKISRLTLLTKVITLYSQKHRNT